jgi:hypothetical protein
MLDAQLENRLFPVVLAGAAAFVWLTGLAMPDVVASHFDADGLPDGHMPRTAYLVVMTVVGIGVPALAAWLATRMLARPDARINLPHRDYWLAPERRAETVAHLRGGILRIVALVAVFLCYLHFVVVRTNLVQPVRLPTGLFVGGLFVFLAVILAYTMNLVRRYRRLPA